MPPRERTWSAAELATRLDHTRLAPDTTALDIERLCEEARLHRFAAVCVNGVHVRRCAGLLGGSGVAVCAVIAFPLGASVTEVKVCEARLALEHGARELDMVLDIGALKAGADELVCRDIGAVVEAAREHAALVKVILETALLSDEEKARACRLSERSGADFVKTSTGFGPRGATVEDVELLRRSVRPHIGVKAAGGIRAAAFARRLLDAGATRLGCSRSVELLREW